MTVDGEIESIVGSGASSPRAALTLMRGLVSVPRVSVIGMPVLTNVASASSTVALGKACL